MRGASRGGDIHTQREDAVHAAAKADRLRNGGRCNDAIKEYERAKAIFDKIGDRHAGAECQHMIGVCFKMLDVTDQAISALLKAERLYRKAGDRSGVGRAYRDIGICHSYRANHAEALIWLLKSEAILRTEASPAELGITQAKIGEIYLKTMDYQVAEDWLRKGLATIRIHGHWFYEMTALMHLGQLLLAIDQPSDSVTTLRAAQAIILDNRDSANYGRRLAQIYGQLAHGYLQLGDRSDAAQLAERAEALLAHMDAKVQAVVRREIDLPSIRSALLAACLCHAPAQRRRRPARDSGAFGPRFAFNYPAVYADEHPAIDGRVR